MPTIKRVEVISIPVRDPERAKIFYADVLGFELIADSPFGEGQRWIQLRPMGAETSVSLVTGLDDFAPGSIRGLLLEVEDLKAAKDQLKGGGVRFTGEIQETPWGRFASFEDPDGNRWSLHEPAREG